MSRKCQSHIFRVGPRPGQQTDHTGSRLTATRMDICNVEHSVTHKSTNNFNFVKCSKGNFWLDQFSITVLNILCDQAVVVHPPEKKSEAKNEVSIESGVLGGCRIRILCLSVFTVRRLTNGKERQQQQAYGWCSFGRRTTWDEIEYHYSGKDMITRGGFGMPNSLKLFIEMLSCRAYLCGI